MQPKEAAIRKRTQIAKANRTMFVWIAASSVLLGFAIVATIFLGQKLVFNEKVLAEKQKTVTILDQNNKAVPDLESAVRVLDTDSNLNSLKVDGDSQAVQVILDALPSSANSIALGASLQSKLLSGINGLTLDTLQVDPVPGDETSNDSSSSTSGNGVITFNFTVEGNETALRSALSNLENSIRTIKVTTLHITSSGTIDTLTVTGEAYYEPAQTLTLKDKVVRP